MYNIVLQDRRLSIEDVAEPVNIGRVMVRTFKLRGRVRKKRPDLREKSRVHH